MTAKKMFEELGFYEVIYESNNINRYNQDKLYKDYYYNEIKFVDRKVFNMAVTLTSKHIQAIHQQMIELGWIDE